jgi:hypothetical protein
MRPSIGDSRLAITGEISTCFSLLLLPIILNFYWPSPSVAADSAIPDSCKKGRGTF